MTAPIEIPWTEEKKLQAAELRAVFYGEAAPPPPPHPADGAAWLQVRARIASTLRGMEPEAARREIGAQVQAARARLEALEDLAGPHKELQEQQNLSTFLEVALLGERIRWLRTLAGAAGESGSAAGHIEFIQSEIRWLTRQAGYMNHADPASRELAAGIRTTARSILESIQMAAIERWLEQSSAAGAPGRPADGFRTAWRRILEYHELAASLDPREAGPAANLLQALRERYRLDLSICSEAIERLEGESLEELLLQSARQLEERTSSLISESDLQENQQRLAGLAAAEEAVEDFLRIIQPSLDRRRRGASRSSPVFREFQRERRRLLWVRRYARRARQTLAVELRLEAAFGRRALRLFENLIFFLIILLLALVSAEWRMEARGVLTPAWAWGFQIADLAICSVLLGDFFLRWAFSGWKGWFLKRHFLVDFLPALPFGFMVGVLENLSTSEHLLPLIEATRTLLFIRVLRAISIGIRSARPVLRGLVPFLRFFRLIIFLVRGSDRIIHHFRGLLDCNVLLFEEQASPARAATLLDEADSLHSRQILLLRDGFRDESQASRAACLAGYLRLLHLESAGQADDGAELRERSEAHTVYLEILIGRLVNANALTIEEALGRNGAQRLCSFLRWADFPVLRSLPIIRRWSPAARIADPLEAAAEAARELGQFFQGILSFFHAWGDLSGITTGPQILDRIATAMIRTTQRPMVRLLIFGSLFSLFYMVVEAKEGVLATIFRWLNNVVGLPLFILGSICMAINLTGRWFKRIAGEALDFYLRTSEAHYFNLLKDYKTQRRDGDAGIIRRRVLLPECRLRGRGSETVEEVTRQFLDELDQRPAGQRPTGKGPGGEASCGLLVEEAGQVALLYRDYLNGSMLQRADDKSSIQLLGNLAMRDIRTGMLMKGRKERRRLEKLALEKDRLLGFGPYIWFRFISESMAIETAKLTLEYNSSCIPLLQTAGAGAEQRLRFDAFLAEKRQVLDPAARRARRSKTDVFEAPLLTTSFNSLHFLRDNPLWDRNIAVSFGPEVLDAMVRDRRAMVRDIFGTWPYHRLPKSLRRFNPYRFYFRHLGGARIFLFPIYLALSLVALLFRGLAKLVKIVREVLGKSEVERGRLSRVAGFDVAVRKINRMRKPYFMEAMHLRAAVDVEYFGIRIPGAAAGPKEFFYQEDLDLIGALEPERRYFEELRRSHLKHIRRLRSFLLTLPDAAPAQTPELLRAIIAAFVSDQHRFRSLIDGPQEALQFFERALRQPPAGALTRARRWLGYQGLRRFLPSPRRRAKIFDRFRRLHPHLADLPPQSRFQALHAFLDAPPAVIRNCEIALQKDRDPAAYRRGIDEVLLRIQCEHRLWSQKLITLRAIQTLTVLDVQSYRDLVWEIGGYGQV